MKKYIFCLAVAVAAALPAFAQNGKEDGVNNWFIGAGAGMNFGFDGSSYISRELSHIGAGTAGDFYVGKYFNSALGFRIGYQGFGTSNQYTNYGKVPFHYAHADLIWRAGKVFTPYLHAGYAHIKSGTPAGGLGIMLPVRLSKRVSIIPDIKATVLNGGTFVDGGTAALGGNLSATVGLQINLGKVGSSKKAAPVSAPVIVPVVPVVVPDEVKADTVAVTQPVIVEEDDPVVPVVPQEEQEEKEEAAVIIPTPAPLPEQGTVLFLFQTDTLTTDAVAILDKWVEFLSTNPDAKVSIEGHTCNIGNAGYNAGLSQRRAKAVRNYLTDAGIDASRIVSVKGYGDTKPAETNDHHWTRARNRRAVIKVVE